MIPTSPIPTRATLAYIRAVHAARRKGRSTFDTFYIIYVGLILSSVAGVLVYRSLHDAALASEDATTVAKGIQALLPGALLLLLVQILAISAWRGPVAVSRADASLLFSAPLPRRNLIRPRLVLALSGGLLAGTGAGIVLFVLVQPKLGTPFARTLTSSVAPLAAFGLIAAALAWEVQRVPALQGALLRWRSVATFCAVLLTIAATLTSAIRDFLLWSGPWGWATAALSSALGQSQPGWIVAAGLLTSLAMTAASRAVATSGNISLEAIVRRAEFGAGFSAARQTLDPRGMAMLQRRALLELVGYRTVRLSLPGKRILALPWRNALSLLRMPGRLIWAGAIEIVAITVVAAYPEDTLAIVGAVLAGYIAAGRLVESMRMEADDPGSSLRLPWRFGDIALLHGVVPFAFMVLVGWAALVGLLIAGTIHPGASPAIFVLGPLLPAALLIRVLRVAMRGRMPLELLIYGAEAVILWILSGPLVTLLTVGAIATWLSAAGARGLGTGGLATFAVIFGGGLVAFTTWRLRKQAPPE